MTREREKRGRAGSGGEWKKQRGRSLSRENGGSIDCTARKPGLVPSHRYRRTNGQMDARQCATGAAIISFLYIYIYIYTILLFLYHFLLRDALYSLRNVISYDPHKGTTVRWSFYPVPTFFADSLYFVHPRHIFLNYILLLHIFHCIYLHLYRFVR